MGETKLIDTKEYIGEIRNNNFGTPMKIIAARNKADIDVQFLDEQGYIWEHNMYRNFIKGELKNPYDKMIFGIGYIGVGKYNTGTSKKHTREHYIWRAMLERCYAEHLKYRCPSYYGIVTVCEEWHNFQNFAEWYHKNKYECGERLQCDKDILYPGNKIYSPENCILVPQSINLLFVKHKPNKFGLPQGISKTETGKYISSYKGQSLGTFSTLEGAIDMYDTKKKQDIVMRANAMREVIPEKLYKVLIDYAMR